MFSDGPNAMRMTTARISVILMGASFVWLVMGWAKLRVPVRTGIRWHAHRPRSHSVETLLSCPRMQSYYGPS